MRMLVVIAILVSGMCCGQTPAWWPKPVEKSGCYEFVRMLGSYDSEAGRVIVVMVRDEKGVLYSTVMKEGAFVMKEGEKVDVTARGMVL